MTTWRKTKKAISMATITARQEAKVLPDGKLTKVEENDRVSVKMNVLRENITCKTKKQG
jgi:hypothetical protein